ncbi:hypothetical protein [Herbaspirillum sp.]|uniref:hypothetical protein n=1 Tax=Herbaspirillum sp. TaxID=1890675 RepID=UPI001B0D0DB8|nr:hypothetical protein [Herbaspirillum sp.]MBO9537049.1 hypothetical protein [Herbaspirillum sp.]
MTDKLVIQWMAEPEDHDYPAAQSYLNLLYDDAKAASYAEQLRKAPVSSFKAKDILRASGLALLGESNSHVDKDRKKVLAGTKLSPLLLVRQAGVKVIVADGYHRLCAVYGFNEDAVIPCKIV